MSANRDEKYIDLISSRYLLDTIALEFLHECMQNPGVARHLDRLPGHRTIDTREQGTRQAQRHSSVVSVFTFRHRAHFARHAATLADELINIDRLACGRSARHGHFRYAPEIDVISHWYRTHIETMS